MFTIPSLLAYSESSLIQPKDYIVENLDFNLDFQQCIVPTAKEFAQFKLSGKLPRFHVNVSHSNIQVVSKVLLLTQLLLTPEQNPELPLLPTPISTTWQQLGMESDDDDEEFHDAEESVSMAPVGSISSKSSVDRVIMAIDFDFTEVSVCLYDAEVQMALVEAKSIKAHSFYRQVESQLSLTIESFVIIDGTSTHDSPYHHIISGNACHDGESSISHLITFEAKYISPVLGASKTDISLVINPIAFNFVSDCMLSIYRLLGSLPAMSRPAPILQSPSSSSMSFKFVQPLSKVKNAIHVSVLIRKVALVFVEGGSSICTTGCESIKLDLDFAGLTVISGTIGRVLISDDTCHSRSILAIDETKAAEFRFEKYESAILQGGYDSSLTLNAESARFSYQHAFLARISGYFEKFREMQVFLDAAKQAAQDSAIQMQKTAGKTRISFSIGTPIIEIPRLSNSQERIVLYLGRISAKSGSNVPQSTAETLILKVESFKLQSLISMSGVDHALDMFEDINLEIEIADFNNATELLPNRQIKVKTNDVVCRCTDYQYQLLMDVIFAFSGQEQAMSVDTPVPAIPELPEAQSGPLSRTNIDVFFPSLMLEIFWMAERMTLPDRNTLAQFKSSTAHFKVEMHSGDKMDAEFRFQSLSLLDTRIGERNMFRDMMIPMSDLEDQFVMKYHSHTNYADYLFTIDQAKLVLDLDHMFAVRDWAVSPFLVPQIATTEVASDIPVIDSHFCCKLNFVDPEIVLVRDPSRLDSDAVVLMANQLTIGLDNSMTVSFKNIGLYFCAMDARRSTQVRFLDDSNLTYIIDSQSNAKQNYSNVSLETSKLLFRLSYQDMLILYDLYSRILAPGDAPTQVVSPENSGSQAIVSESLKVVISGIQAVFIDDLNDLHLPVYEFQLASTNFEMTNWSSRIALDFGTSVSADFFNMKNSSWEPFIEKWKFSINARREGNSPKLQVDLFCRQKLEMNISHAFIESILAYTNNFSTQKRDRSVSRSTKAPYIIKNMTGYSIHVWTQTPGSGLDRAISKIETGSSLEWRFDDWRTMREKHAPSPNKLYVQVEGAPWETIKDIHVDKEGVQCYVLRPALDRILHQLVAEVTIENKVKIVTLRSTTQLKNVTNVPIEVRLSKSYDRKICSVFKLLPGVSLCIPIEASYSELISVRPADFRYHWSNEHLTWRDIDPAMLNIVLSCKATDPGSPDFQVQSSIALHSKDTTYPNLTITLLAPFLIENLLPYEFRYLILDRVTKQEHRSVLKPGDKDPLHTLDPNHLLGLAISIPEVGLKQKDVSIITSSELQYRDESLVLFDKTGLQLNLRVKYEDEKEGQGKIVTVYSPYLLINKTGCNMEFSTTSLMTGQRSIGGKKASQKAEFIEPILFSYSKFEPLQSRAKVKVQDSLWSQSLSFEAVGSAFTVSLPLDQIYQEMQVGIDIQEGAGKYYMTKVVTFQPRYILRNSLDERLDFRMHESSPVQHLAPGSTIPLLHIRKEPGFVSQICLRLANMISEWSNPFHLDDIGTTYVKMSRIGSNTEDLIRVEISVEKATLYLSFHRQERHWPVKIMNSTNVNMIIRQTNSKKPYMVQTGETLSYAWDFPSISSKALVLMIYDTERIIEMSQLGKLPPMKYPLKNSNRMGIIALEIVADGMALVLNITPYNSRASKFKVEDGPQGTEITPVEDESKVLSIVQIRLEGIGISIISRRMEELAYFTLKSLVCVYTETDEDRKVSASLKWIQADNQIYGAMEPILIYPTVVPNEENEDEKPIFLATMSLSKDSSRGADYFHWFMVLLQELSVDLDEDFLYAAMDFFQFKSQLSNSPEILYDGSNSFDFPKSADTSDRMYFEKLLLQPIQVNLSFARMPRSKGDMNRPQSSNWVTFVYDVLTMTIGNITDAPIRLNALDLDHGLLSRTQLLERIFKFYYQEMIGQVHSIIGAADFLGNPVGLFNNVASGVRDMFYEPIQGFQITKPQEFGLGVAKGASSLVKKTVFGLSDTLSKLTGSLGKGLSVMTLDEKVLLLLMVSFKKRGVWQDAIGQSILVRV